MNMKWFSLRMRALTVSLSTAKIPYRDNLFIIVYHIYCYMSLSAKDDICVDPNPCYGTGTSDNEGLNIHTDLNTAYTWNEDSTVTVIHSQRN